MVELVNLYPGMPGVGGEYVRIGNDCLYIVVEPILDSVITIGCPSATAVVIVEYVVELMILIPMVMLGGPPADVIVTPLDSVDEVDDTVYTVFEGYSGWNADPHDRVTEVSVRPYLKVVGGFVNTYADADSMAVLDTPLIREYTRIFEVLP